MAIQFSTTTRQNQANQLITDVGSAARLKIYSSPRPANPQAAATGTLLADLTFAGAFGTSTNGVITLGTINPDTSADASGTAAWFRVFKSDNTTAVIDGSAGTSGTDLVLTSAATTAGAQVSVTSGTITMGNA
jgi:hypothetical protein